MRSVALAFGLLALCGCGGVVAHDEPSLLLPALHKSEIYGFLAGLGTTFAAVPDVIAMVRQRSSAAVNPRMAAILAVFQLVWVYYGFLIGSRPVVAWNLVAVVINALAVGAWVHFAHRERRRAGGHRAHANT
jgi:uncharacterized protein with PQ loop repeat